MSNEILTFQLTPEHYNQRLDKLLSELMPEFSRNKIQEWISQGKVSLNGVVTTLNKTKVQGIELVQIEVEHQVQLENLPENLPLDIVYEDDQILVINKPADFVVHPGAGNPNGTILNALIYHYPDIVNVPRAGIVHRLDKDTTGLMVIAKTPEAQTSLVKQLEERSVTREYEALVHGIISRGGSVNEPIERHPTKRTLMAVSPNGRESLTKYRVMQPLRNYTRLRLRLATGRTHQIRAHMSHIGHPLLGDTPYGGSVKLPKNADPSLVAALQAFKRQALHAIKLELNHPTTGEHMSWEVPLPQQHHDLVVELQQDYKKHQANQ